MKKLLIPSLLALMLGTFASAQTRSPEIEALLRQDNHLAGINTKPYVFHEYRDTPAPRGYHAFYISHYGRHGSRSDWGIPSYERLIRTLEEARKRNILTARGDSLLAEATAVLDYTDGMNGRLTQRGVREHQKLAEHLYSRYKRVFRKGNKKINAFSSTSPRCILSMTGFTGQLIAMDPELQFTWDTGERFYDYIGTDCTPEMRERSEPVLDSILATHPLRENYTIDLLFSDRAQAHELVPDERQLERDIYETARVTEGFDMDNNIYRFLSFEALYKWYDYYNMEMYLRQGNSRRYGLERMPLTQPLVNDIVARADEAIRTGNVTADLRFGHDYTVVSLGGYLGLEGVGDRLTIQEAQKTWCGGIQVCFAENIQLIFYRKGTGDPVLVKFLFNENETLLRGLEPVTGPYYEWDQVKKNIKGYLR